MIFRISNHDGTSDTVVNAKRHIARNIAECLTENHLVPVEEAIIAGSWCELACVGEVYEGETFRIEVDDR